VCRFYVGALRRIAGHQAKESDPYFLICKIFLEAGNYFRVFFEEDF